MQLSSSAVVQAVNNLLIQGENSPQNEVNPYYAQAYQVILNDLNSQGITITPADQSVLNFLTAAIQINSASNTLASVAIRINNAVADQLENGQSIALFGPESQASSNAVAQAFLSSVVNDP